MELRREPDNQSQKKVDKVLYVDLDVHHGDGKLADVRFYHIPTQPIKNRM